MLGPDRFDHNNRQLLANRGSCIAVSTTSYSGNNGDEDTIARTSGLVSFAS